MYVPQTIVPDIRVHFAIDNCDFKNDTPDGKNQFHATAQVIIQKSDNCSLQQHLPINGSAKKSKSDDISAEKIMKPSILDEKFFQILMGKLLASSKMITATLIEHEPYVK